MIEQRLEAGDWPRHRHMTAYAAIVLSGGYLEAGSEGRWKVEAGDVVVHPAFDLHQNRLSGRAWVLNLPLDALTDLPPVFRVRDLDELEHAWRCDLRVAASLLDPQTVKQPLAEDWPDLLAARLRDDSRLNLGAWAKAHGLDSPTVSRGYVAAFGITPARHRAEQRARRAWRRLMLEPTAMAELALDCGFADQAHFSRSVTAMTGRTPAAWRRKSLQDRAAGAR